MPREYAPVAKTLNKEMARKWFVSAIAISAMALCGSSACATKKMVKQRVGEVDSKAAAAAQRAAAAGARADEAYGAAD